MTKQLIVLMAFSAVVLGYVVFSTSQGQEGPKGKVKAMIGVPCIARSDDQVKSTKDLARALKKLPSLKLIPHSSATPMVIVEFDLASCQC
jgi:hypothetical protein